MEKPAMSIWKKINLIPQETKFFELFEESAANVVEAGHLLLDMVENFQEVSAKAKKLFACEHHGDKITHRIMLELSQTFVTPMDREDIQALAGALDNVLDLIEEAGDRLDLYRIEKPTPELIDQVRILLRATEALHSLVQNLPNLRNPKSFEEQYIHLHDIENEGDRLARHMISNLFQHASDALEVVKWKDIYEDIESAIDMCEDAADVIQTIVLKHA